MSGDKKWLELDDEDRRWYVNHVREQCVHARQLLSIANWPDLTRVFHNLKGSGISFGYEEVSAWGLKGEEACENKDRKVASSCLDSLESVIAAETN